MKKLLILLFTLICGLSATFATDYEIGTGGTTSSSAYMPIAFSSLTYNSISQQLYFASELTEAGASAGSITAISFYYMSSTAKSRTCEVWINEVTKTQLASTEGADQWMYGISPSNPAPGTKVFDGTVSIPASSGWYTITLNSSFAWGGTKNIVITINDKTDARSNMTALSHKVYTTSESTKPCGIYNTAGSGSSFNAGNAYNLKGTAVKSAPVIKFSFASSTPAPTSPTSTDITHNSATIGWTAAEGADSYEVRYGTTSGSLGDETNVGNVTSYDISGLEASTKYYFQVRTKIGDAYSAWTDEANFTTAAHIHNAITFEKWTWSNILPTAAGNYYLTHDVTLSGNWEPGGSINLCLNGHKVSFGSNYGIINGVTVAIYDFDDDGYFTSSNSTQTLLVSGSTSNLFVDRDELVINSAGGRKIVVAENGYAAINSPLDFDDDVNNNVSFIEYEGIHIYARINRTITSASYNTLCLPFNLSNDELQEAFGSGYDLEEFTGSSLDATTLNLSFTQRTNLVAGKPYLILPSVTAVDPSFVGVTISATTPSSSTSEFADFIGIYNPTELTVDNRNTLFLGASNTLFFPSETANMPGFRGYFSVKGGAQQAIQAVIFPQHTSPTGIENVNQKSEIKNHKYLIDGQLIIIRDGIEYNAQGIRL